jgi:hypothetical protein
MKRLIIYTGLVLIAAAMGISSCTEDFQDINTNPIGVSDEDLLQDNNAVGLYFVTLQESVHFNYDYGEGNSWTYQVYQNLNADIWSGYMATASHFAGGVNNQTYFMVSGWNDNCWNWTYAYLMTTSQKIKEKIEETGSTYVHFGAINDILRVLGMSRMVDQYGPIIYTKYGESLTGGAYDSGIDAYKAFFRELTEAVSELNEALNKPVASFASFDMAYKGDLSKWIKLANSLRLRLAMRIVKYDSALAKQEFEAALNAPEGLLLHVDELLQFSGFNYGNPLYTLSVSWNDISINANLISIMGGYEDARLPKYGTLDQNGKVSGVRAGIPGLDVIGPKYKEVISRFNIADAFDPLPLFSPAETYFLLAEAALRGWNVPGSAQQYYESGVRVSFEQWGAPIGDYLESTKKPADWIDSIESAFNATAASAVSPKWADASSDEDRLEKIITQKWIANWPEGMNAWAEVRRTGYPKLFKILENKSENPVIPTELGPRRLPYPLKEKADNPKGYADAVQMLGGNDNANTRIFWDVDKPNL